MRLSEAGACVLERVVVMLANLFDAVNCRGYVVKIIEIIVHFLDRSVYNYKVLKKGEVGGGCKELDRDHLSGQMLSNILKCNECALICQLL